MSEEETNVAAVDETTAATSPAPELTLTEKVAADEAEDVKDDAEVAALKLEVTTLEANLSAQQALVASLVERVVALEGAPTVSPDGFAAKIETLEALVAKMHEKMKLLIPMD